VQSLTLPSNADVVVLAVDLVQAAGAPTRAAAPTFSPAPGNFGSAQSVTLSDTTPGTVIYYTTNGTTPTTSSAQYSPGTPIPVSTTTTIEAIAAASGYSNSAVASGTYTITQAGRRSASRSRISPTSTPSRTPERRCRMADRRQGKRLCEALLAP